MSERVRVDVGLGHVAANLFRPPQLWSNVNLPIRVQSPPITLPRRHPAYQSGNKCTYQVEFFCANRFTLDHEDLLLALLKVLGEHNSSVYRWQSSGGTYGWIDTSKRYLCEQWRGPTSTGGRQLSDLQKYLTDLSTLLIGVSIHADGVTTYSPMPIVRWVMQYDATSDRMFATRDRSQHLRVAINRHFFAAMVGHTYAAQIDLIERRHLAGDIAKSLHRTLSIWLRATGAKLMRGVTLEKLVEIIYSGEVVPPGPAGRRRRGRQRAAIIEAMDRISQLPAWEITQDPEKHNVHWRVRRLSDEQVTDELRQCLFDPAEMAPVEQIVNMPSLVLNEPLLDEVA